jgi:hypothetical protein
MLPFILQSVAMMATSADEVIPNREKIAFTVLAD